MSNFMNKKIDKNSPIGVIDSGVGGLTVLKWLQEKMPAEDFLYIGDTARCPYGNAHTEDEIFAFAAQMVDTLGQKGVKMIVVACNTISMFGKDNLRFGYELPIVTMSLGTNLVLSATKTKKIGVFATPFTIGKQLHYKAIMTADPSAKLTMVPCPDFVPMIEGEKFGSLQLRMMVTKYCKNLRDDNCDTLLLACTHYPFVREEIRKDVGEEVVIIDPAEQTALDTIAVLEENNLRKTEGVGRARICCTADISRMRRLAGRILDLGKCEFSELQLAKL